MFSTARKLEKKILSNMPNQYKRYLFNKIDYSSQLIGIVGARGVGKTTILLQYINELKNKLSPHKSLYFSYDYPGHTDLKLIELAEEFSKQGGEVLILDEIHKYQNFSQELKAIYDFYPDLKVIFSGSCASSIYNSQADLSRRVVLYKMVGLSYREFLCLKLKKKLPTFSLNEILNNNIEIIDSLENEFIPLEFFNEYLEQGYYPFYFSNKENYLNLLSATINLTIDVDFVSLGLVSSSFTNKLKKLLYILSESNPFELNISKIAANMEVSRNTIYSYLLHLEKGGLIHPIVSSKKGLSKLAKPEKLYLNNTNMFYAYGGGTKNRYYKRDFFCFAIVRKA